jgi:hypothetical protein
MCKLILSIILLLIEKSLEQTFSLFAEAGNSLNIGGSNFAQISNSFEDENFFLVVNFKESV